MVVTLHIISESSDHYTELFVNKTVEEIKKELYDGMEWFSPVGEYYTTFDGCTKAEEKEVLEMLSQWSDDSWNHEYDEEDV